MEESSEIYVNLKNIKVLYFLNNKNNILIKSKELVDDLCEEITTKQLFFNNNSQNIFSLDYFPYIQLIHFEFNKWDKEKLNLVLCQLWIKTKICNYFDQINNRCTLDKILSMKEEAIKLLILEKIIHKRLLNIKSSSFMKRIFGITSNFRKKIYYMLKSA